MRHERADPARDGGIRMMKHEKSRWLLVALAIAVFAVGVLSYAGSAAQIYVAGCGLEYVRHTNNLPAGRTTLVVTNNAPQQQVRITFGARAVDGTNLTRTIDTGFAGASTRSFTISWGKAITDLNFIQIRAPFGCRDGRSG
jgi:hypothetical protein